MKAIEQWVSRFAGTGRVLGVIEMYTKYDEHQKLVLLVAKVNDNLLAGTEKTVIQFFDLTKSIFEIQKMIIGNRISFNGCNSTQQNDEKITMKMTEYLTSI